jgi:hypothetical protein
VASTVGSVAINGASRWLEAQALLAVEATSVAKNSRLDFFGHIEKLHQYWEKKLVLDLEDYA